MGLEKTRTNFYICPYCKSSKVELILEKGKYCIDCMECGNKYYVEGGKKMSTKEQVRRLMLEGFSVGDIIEKLNPPTARKRKYIRECYRKIKQELGIAESDSKAGEPKTTSIRIKMTPKARPLSEEPIKQAAETIATDLKLLYQQLAIIKNAVNQMMDIISKQLGKESK